MFADNKQSEFTVRLDHPIHVEDERWEVALDEIATPSEVLNITEENNFFFLTFLDQRILNRIGMENITEMCSNDIACDKYKLYIPTGNYVSPEYLAERGARWLSGRVSDSGARGRGFETYRRVVSLSKTLYSTKVLVNYPGSGGSIPTWLKNCWLGR